MKQLGCIFLCALVICGMFAGCKKKTEGSAPFSDERKEEIGNAWEAGFHSGLN